jgi:hypothetical protein
LIGLLQTSDGLVLKPVLQSKGAIRELELYTRLFKANGQTNDLNLDEMQLKKFMPNYRGTLRHNNSRPKIICNLYKIYLIN